MRKGKWTSYVATAVDEHGAGSSDHSFLPVSVEQTATGNCYIPRVCNNDNRTWKTKVISSQTGLIDNPMCPCEEEETMDHLIFKCNKLNEQRSEIIKQIKDTCGTWSLTPETIVNYLLFFKEIY
jgi:hypothetical protein